jgi:tetratricopeptide (TPR) repeat protein
VAAGLIVGLASCGNGSTKVAPDSKGSAEALTAGFAAHKAGRLKVAATDYRIAIDYNGRNKIALFNLALLDSASGNYGPAEERYRNVLRIDPSYEPALFNLAILRTDRGDDKDALQLYERAVVANSKAAGAWLNLGLLQRANGQRTAGDLSVLKAIKLNPKLKDPVMATAFRSPVPAPTAR